MRLRISVRVTPREGGDSSAKRFRQIPFPPRLHRSFVVGLGSGFGEQVSSIPASAPLRYYRAVRASS